MKDRFYEKKGLLMRSNNVNKRVLVERRECYILSKNIYKKFITAWIKLVFNLCLEQCVNQVICGRIMLIPSIWICVVEHTKSTTLDGKLIY